MDRPTCKTCPHFQPKAEILTLCPDYALLDADGLCRHGSPSPIHPNRVLGGHEGTLETIWPGVQEWDSCSAHPRMKAWIRS
jgi:hypothetical protein